MSLEANEDYIRSWKELGEYTGYHPNYLRILHYQQVKLPFVKLGENRQSKWIVSHKLVDLWIGALALSSKRGNIKIKSSVLN